MSRRTHTPQDDPLDRFLAAAGAELEPEAESAWAELFAALPARAPRAGFADRVMLAVAVAQGAPALALARPGFFASRLTRAVLAVTLAGAALLAAVAPEVLLALLKLASPSRLLDLAVRGFTAAAEGVVSACALLWHFDTLGRAAALLLSAPPIAGALAGGVLVSAVAFYLLHDLLTNRSWSHAQPV